MTPQEKQLLLKDLCARLPYGVKCFAPDKEYGDVGVLFSIEPLEDTDPNIWIQYPKGNTISNWPDDIKPYLRPISSMTEKEKIELCTISYAPDEMKTIEEKLYVIKTNAENAADFYNKHHFDYRGLIPMGLALEAKEGMYKTE